MTSSTTPRRAAGWRAVAIVAVGVAASALALTAAPAATARPVTQVPASAMVRGAHLSPDTPGVDVYLTSYGGKQSAVWQSDLGYGDVTAYRPLAAGLYVVAMRPHGASPSTPAALKWVLNAKAGAAYTVAAVGTNAKLTGTVLDDTLTAPQAGDSSIRIIQAASRAPAAKIVASPNVVLAPDARFPTATSYTSVPAGTWQVTASAVNSAVSTSAPVTVKAGTVYSVLVLDAKTSGITLRLLQDASGTSTSPTGPVDAGGGGTAPRPSADSPAGDWWAGGLGAAAVLAFATIVLWRRRPEAAA